MKFLCVKCDQSMQFKEAADPEDGSLSIIFACAKCHNEIALLTNPGETQLVKALDVQIGGPPPGHQPMQLLRGALAEPGAQTTPGEADAQDDEGITWTTEAEERLAAAPQFVRDMVRKGTEQYARSNGYREITSQVLDEAKGSMSPHSGG